MKKFGRADIFLMAFMLLLLLAGALFFRLEGENNLYGEITLDGELYRRIELTGHRGRESFEIETPKGRNTILIEDETIRVLEADCPDKICVKTGRLSKAGETAACLPHKLLIEIKAGPLP